MSLDYAESPSASTDVLRLFSDIESLRLDADVGGASSGEVFAYFAVRKPTRQEWFRVHPDPNMSLATSLYVDKEGGRRDEVYFVAPAMRDTLFGDYKVATLLLAMNRQNVPFLWPVNVPDHTKRVDPWGETAREAAALSKSVWVRMAADMPMGAYRIFTALKDFPEPTWPDLSFSDFLAKAFQGRIIDSLDHPVIRRLRGLE